MQIRLPWDVVGPLLVATIFAVVGKFVVVETYRGLDVEPGEFGWRVLALRVRYYGSEPSSQRRLAEALGVSQDFLEGVERGKLVAGEAFKRKLIETFPHHTDLLFGRIPWYAHPFFWLWCVHGWLIGFLWVQLLKQSRNHGLGTPEDTGAGRQDPWGKLEPAQGSKPSSAFWT